MSILKIDKLCKTYENFSLDNVSFEMDSLESGKGTIMGFIGRNGAGKTTTLKSILNMVHPTSGTVEVLDMNFSQNEFLIKQNIGFVTGGIDFYSTCKLKKISKVTKKFYNNWDESSYRSYLKLFNLDEEKTPKQLSAGMRVKFLLALALSHNAKLLILDEPTSGLDPVSRDELLDVFLDLADKNVSILFSTHITSDLEKCADNITYIKKGRIISSLPLKTFVEKYQVIECEGNPTLNDKDKNLLIGKKRTKTGFSALVNSYDVGEVKEILPDAKFTNGDLESIMVHLEKED